MHRDIKLQNIMMTDNSEQAEPKLVDFGLAKQLGQSRMTASGAVMGTSHYMAPEQVLGKSKEINARCDVWARGVIMYELATGRLPFVGQTTVELCSDAQRFNVGPNDAVNCVNGEVSLVDGQWQLGPHVKEHYRTTQIPVTFDPAEAAPKFERFLNDIFASDADAEDKKQAILEMIGYTLMSHCQQEKFVMLIGPGGNGKSVLLAVLEALLGTKNVAGVQPAQFDRTFQRAHLGGKLANIVSEMKQGALIPDAELKAIVSGELTTVEHKNKDPFDIRPYATCWFGTNHMPATRDFSEGMFRRTLIIEFNAKLYIT